MNNNVLTQAWTQLKLDWRTLLLEGCNAVLDSFVNSTSLFPIAELLLSGAIQDAVVALADPVQVNVALSAVHLRMLLDVSRCSPP
jgi:hypothetical protein